MIWRREIIARFHSQAAADEAQRSFIARFQQGVVPENLEEQVVDIDGDKIRLSALLKQLGLVASTSEAMRKIEEGAVRVDQEKVVDRQCELHAGAAHIVAVGKRSVARVRIRARN